MFNIKGAKKLNLNALRLASLDLTSVILYQCLKDTLKEK